MKFKNQIVYRTTQELEKSLSNGDYNLSCLVVDISLKHLKSKKKSIPIVSIYAQEDDLYFDLTLDVEDIKDTLNQNLKIMESYEDYERCQKIVDGVKYLEKRKK
jgi:hypothetical protein